MFAYKIVMVGDFGVGKTSLVKRFVDNSFSEDYLSSIGVAMSKKLLTTDSGLDSTMMLWDIEGKTEYKAIFKHYLMGAKAFIIVADLTRHQTIESIKEHIKTCEEVVKDAYICIALNKCDLQSDSIIPIEELKSLSKNIISIYKTSAKSGDTVNKIFTKINLTIVDNHVK